MFILARHHHMVLGIVLISFGARSVKQILAQIVPLYRADLSPVSSQTIIPVRVKQVQVEPSVLGLEKWLAEPHNIWPCSETPPEKKVGRQADSSIYRLLSLSSHSTLQTPCAVCITTGLNRCQSFWCILQIGNKISSAAIQTNYALV